MEQFVRQKEDRPNSSRDWIRATRGAAILLVLAVAGAACATDSDTGPLTTHDDGAKPGKPDAVDARNPEARTAIGAFRSANAQAVALAAYQQGQLQAGRVLAAQKWGLNRAPLLPPAPPAKKPKLTTEKGWETETGGPGLPPVITRVPTKDKVIFLTMDDGSNKDPRLIKMMKELNIPYSAFLTDREAGEDGYDYFRRMHKAGVPMHNHTLTHPELRKMTYAQQYKEICGQQENLKKAFGKRPPLFRPPYGDYNGDSLLAAKRCGVRAVPLWQQEVFPTKWDYRRADRRFHPGDIVLTHFRGSDEWDGTMPDVVRQVLKKADREGYAIARLEDYV
ncbi:polysaccharide deacetylase family protein [Streptomyces boninensis]|uniref:polysaccharide deacetylase family protein n=1 Tax=Streptomyces boninensis TaxID=2039455 RepID=UPI003B218EA1